MAKLKDKVAIITGAASGMGEAHAKKFIEEGATVVIADISDARDDLANELGDNAISMKLDVTDEKNWEDVIEAVEEQFGRIDILVNNAGISGGATNIADFDSEEYLKIIDINLNGYFYGIKSVYPSLKKQGGGSIINIGSAAAVRHVRESQNFAYTTSKHGVIGLTKSAAIDLAEDNIRVNAVNPGIIETPMMEEALTKEQIEEFTQGIPMKKLGAPEQVSDLIAFLASDEANYISGEDILIDGALLAR